MNHPSLPTALGGDGADIGAYESDSMLRITQINLVDWGAVSIAFQSETGSLYGLEYTTNLSAGDWTFLPAGYFLGTGGIIEVIDTDWLQPQRFYRVTTQ